MSEFPVSPSPPASEDTERATEVIGRFQSLLAGQYWRALVAIPDEAIEPGEVLLIQSIRWVDNKAHTIILLPHPSKIDRSIAIKKKLGKGRVETHWVNFTEHRFLLQDFLVKFEYEPDAQKIRAAEVAQVQQQVNDLQQELLTTQASPALLAQVVEEGLRDAAEEERQEAKRYGRKVKKTPQLPVPTGAESAAAAQITAGTIADALAEGMTPEKIESLQRAVKREHQVATVKAKWIESKTTAIAETLGRMAPYYQEHAIAALAATEDVRTYVSSLLDGIQSLDLYVGKDVSVETIRKGESASPDVPLTFMQKKLLMDEEMAAFEDVDRTFDFEHDGRFLEALRTHDGLVDQIFPTQRCVLVMATTSRVLEYAGADSYSRAHRDEMNKLVFMLVRDGMNIYRVYSPIASHLRTDTLFPFKDDQDRIFKGVDGSSIKFEDIAYTDSVTKHERFALHYKRFLIMACGLDHRLGLFGEFYPGPKNMKFVSMEFQEKYCQFVYDDGKNVLPDGSNRPGINEWIRERNAFIRSGSRVLCLWRNVLTPETAPGACRRRHSRHHGEEWDLVFEPPERIGVEIAFKEGRNICVGPEVEGYSYNLGADRKFTCKVTLNKYKSKYIGDELGYLCLDAVTSEDLRYYIHNRKARRDQILFIRFLKMALAQTEQDEQYEADTRGRMLRALEEGNIGKAGERADIISRAVIAWRAANRGKPLPVFDGDTAPQEWKSLLDQMFMLTGEGENRVKLAEAFVTDQGLTPLRMVLSGGARLVVYAAPAAAERDDRLERFPWVHRITFETGRKGVIEIARRWALLPKLAASETTLHEWADAESWAGLTSVFASPAHKTSLFAETDKFHEYLSAITQVKNKGVFQTQFARWQMVRSGLNVGAKSVRNPLYAIPFGLSIDKYERTLTFLCLVANYPEAALYHMAVTREEKTLVRDEYVDIYHRKDLARKRFDETVKEYPQWDLNHVGTALAAGRTGNYVHVDLMKIWELMWQNNGRTLNKRFDNWKSAGQYASCWVNQSVLDENGKINLEELLKKRKKKK